MNKIISKEDKELRKLMRGYYMTGIIAITLLDAAFLLIVCQLYSGGIT